MQTDFSHRGTHLMTVVGKAVTVAYYVRRPAISLFSGCSGGGNSGLGELQRYPDDYDGIAIGSPPIGGSYLSLLQGLSYAESRRDPASIIGREKAAGDRPGCPCGVRRARRIEGRPYRRSPTLYFRPFRTAMRRRR